MRDGVTNTINSTNLKVSPQEYKTSSNRKSQFTRSLSRASKTNTTTDKSMTSTGRWKKDTLVFHKTTKNYLRT